MDKDLLVICPTRGRTLECTRMIKSFEQKTSEKARLIFIIDVDDPCFEMYETLFQYTKHSFYIKNPDQTLAKTYNTIVKSHYIGYKFYSITCDDYIYHTGNWDRILVRKLEEEGPGFAYGNDKYGGSNLPTTCIISAEIIEALGYIVLPTLEYLYGDNVWRDIGLAVGKLFYIPEVNIEHLTPLAGKAEKDDTFRRTNSQEMYIKDQEAYRIWIHEEKDNDVKKIKEILCSQK